MDSYSSPLLHVGAAEKFVREAVDAAGVGNSVRSVETVEEARALIEREPIAGVVAENTLPDGSGLDLLGSDGSVSVPFVLLARVEAARTEAIDAGASDVFVRDGADEEATVLGRRLANVFSQRETLSEYAMTMADTVLLLDCEGRVVAATLEAGGVFESSTAEQLVGKSLSEVVVEEDVTHVKQHFQRLATGDVDRETVKLSFRREDGSVVPGEIRFTTPPTADSLVVATLQDVLRREDPDQRSASLVDLLLDTIDDAFYMLDAGGNLIRWNDHFAAVTGYSDAEIAEMNPLEFFVEEDRDRVAGAIREIFETGSGGVEAEMITKEGERIPYDYTGAALTDDSGMTRGVVGIGRDISERKERERELHRYETIIDVLADPVYALDADGRYSYVNDAFVEHTGYDCEEIVGAHASKVLPEEEIERGREVIRDLLSTEDRESMTWEMSRVTADGKRIPTENHTALLPRGEDGEFRGSVGVVRDISERKAREQRLRREHDRLESVFDAAPNPFVHVTFEDGEPIVLQVNEAFEAVFGFDEDTLVGNSIDDYILPETGHETAKKLNERGRTGKSTRMEVTRQTADGEQLEFLFKSATITREDGAVEGVGAYVDITEQKRRIELLDQLRQNVTDVVWMTDPEKGSMDFISDAYEEVWGRSTESLRAEPNSFVDAIHPEDRERVASAIDAQQTDPGSYEEIYRVQQPDGETRWVRDRSSGVYEDGELKRIVGVATDITERKEREAELRLKNRVMDEAPIGITIHDATQEGCPISYANDGFEQLTGYAPSAVEGTTLSMLGGAETDDATLAELTDAVEQRRSASLALLLYQADGTPFWGRVSLAPVTDEAGETTHLVGFLQDVTTIKEHEQEVARRLEEFGDLLAEDLRVPVQQAQDEIASASTGGDSPDIEDAKHSLERVEKLIEDLTTVHARSVTSREVGDVLRTENGNGADE
jgi:PAS domain S-box-containing protein